VKQEKRNPTKHRINPRSLKNLKHEKGYTGNPGGRPKTSDLRQFLLEWLAAKANGNKTRQLQLIEQIAKKKPEIILYYAYGKPIETLEVTGKDGQAIQVEHMSKQDLRAQMIQAGEMTPEGRLIPQRN
jgi:hypothetical protein